MPRFFINQNKYMDREELKSRLDAITNLRTQQNELYEVLDALGVTYQKTTCLKCRRDLLAIAREELGVIADASEESGFDTTEYRYTYAYGRPLRVDGKVYDRLSSQEDLETLYGKLGRVYVKREAVESGQSE